MRILALTRPLKGGVRRQQLLSALGKKVEIKTIQIHLPFSRKILNYLLCFHGSRTLWRERVRKNEFFFNAMSREAGKAISRHGKASDVIFLFEGLFGPGRPDFWPPYVIYEDTTAEICRHKWPAWVPDTMNSPEYRRYEASIYRNALAAFALTEATKRSFIEDYGLDPAKAYNIGMGANMGLRMPDGGGEKNFILFAGYESGRKNLDILIKAFNLLEKEEHPVYLYIAGPDMYLDDPYVVATGRIHDRDKLRHLYDQALVFVMPSQFDPFPTAVLEAMGRGVPVIVSDGCGAAEIIEHGKNGLVFPKNDAAALAGCLEMVIKNHEFAKSLGCRAYETVLNGFTWDQVADRMLSIITGKMYGSVSPKSSI